jgi:Leucine-rich repeat (LRR) protein
MIEKFDAAEEYKQTIGPEWTSILMRRPPSRFRSHALTSFGKMPLLKGMSTPTKEKPMIRSLRPLLTVAVCLSAGPLLRADEPQTEREKAVALVKKLGGRVEVDEKAKDSPIVAVHLSDTKVNDADLEALKSLTQLHRLYLQNTTITDAGLEHLQALTELQTLSLNHTKVTDAGLDNLKGLSKLKTLSLANTRVTNKGLEQLKGLTKLQTLHLKGSLVTDSGAKELTTASPKLEIDR